MFKRFFSTENEEKTKLAALVRFFPAIFFEHAPDVSVVQSALPLSPSSAADAASPISADASTGSAKPLVLSEFLNLVIDLSFPKEKIAEKYDCTHVLQFFAFKQGYAVFQLLKLDQRKTLLTEAKETFTLLKDRASLLHGQIEEIDKQRALVLTRYSNTRRDLEAQIAVYNAPLSIETAALIKSSITDTKTKDQAEIIIRTEEALQQKLLCQLEKDAAKLEKIAASIHHQDALLLAKTEEYKSAHTDFSQRITTAFFQRKKTLYLAAYQETKALLVALVENYSRPLPEDVVKTIQQLTQKTEQKEINFIIDEIDREIKHQGALFAQLDAQNIKVEEIVEPQESLGNSGKSAEDVVQLATHKKDLDHLNKEIKQAFAQRKSALFLVAYKKAKIMLTTFQTRYSQEPVSTLVAPFEIRQLIEQGFDGAKITEVKKLLDTETAKTKQLLATFNGNKERLVASLQEIEGVSEEESRIKRECDLMCKEMQRVFAKRQEALLLAMHEILNTALEMFIRSRLCPTLFYSVNLGSKEEDRELLNELCTNIEIVSKELSSLAPSAPSTASTASAVDTVSEDLARSEASVPEPAPLCTQEAALRQAGALAIERKEAVRILFLSKEEDAVNKPLKAYNEAKAELLAFTHKTKILFDCRPSDAAVALAASAFEVLGRDTDLEKINTKTVAEMAKLTACIGTLDAASAAFIQAYASSADLLSQVGEGGGKDAAATKEKETMAAIQSEETQELFALKSKAIYCVQQRLLGVYDDLQGYMKIFVAGREPVSDALRPLNNLKGLDEAKKHLQHLECVFETLNRNLVLLAEQASQLIVPEHTQPLVLTLLPDADAKQLLQRVQQYIATKPWYKKAETQLQQGYEKLLGEIRVFLTDLEKARPVNDANAEAKKREDLQRAEVFRQKAEAFVQDWQYWQLLAGPQPQPSVSEAVSAEAATPSAPASVSDAASTEVTTLCPFNGHSNLLGSVKQAIDKKYSPPAANMGDGDEAAREVASALPAESDGRQNQSSGVPRDGRRVRARSMAKTSNTKKELVEPQQAAHQVLKKQLGLLDGCQSSGGDSPGVVVDILPGALLAAIPAAVLSEGQTFETEIPHEPQFPDAVTSPLSLGLARPHSASPAVGSALDLGNEESQVTLASSALAHQVSFMSSDTFSSSAGSSSGRNRTQSLPGQHGDVDASRPRAYSLGSVADHSHGAAPSMQPTLHDVMQGLPPITAQDADDANSLGDEGLLDQPLSSPLAAAVVSPTLDQPPTAHPDGHAVDPSLPSDLNADRDQSGAGDGAVGVPEPLVSPHGDAPLEGASKEPLSLESPALAPTTEDALAAAIASQDEAPLPASAATADALPAQPEVGGDKNSVLRDNSAAGSPELFLVASPTVSAEHVSEYGWSLEPTVEVSAALFKASSASRSSNTASTSALLEDGPQEPGYGDGIVAANAEPASASGGVGTRQEPQQLKYLAITLKSYCDDLKALIISVSSDGAGKLDRIKKDPDKYSYENLKDYFLGHHQVNFEQTKLAVFLVCIEKAGYWKLFWSDWGESYPTLHIKQKFVTAEMAHATWTQSLKPYLYIIKEKLFLQRISIATTIDGARSAGGKVVGFLKQKVGVVDKSKVEKIVANPKAYSYAGLVAYLHDPQRKGALAFESDVFLRSMEQAGFWELLWRNWNLDVRAEVVEYHLPIAGLDPNDVMLLLKAGIATASDGPAPAVPAPAPGP